MNTFILSQYFIVTMTLTVTIGLFTLKPTIEPDSSVTAQIISVVDHREEVFFNAQYK